MSANKIATFWIDVCALSGDPGCLGWPDADHDGPCKYAKGEYHQCTECRADDVYGELFHETDCSLYVAPEVRLRLARARHGRTDDERMSKCRRNGCAR